MRSKPSLHTQIIYDFGQDSYLIHLEKPVKKGRFNEKDTSMKIDLTYSAATLIPGPIVVETVMPLI
jgi:hypothetical protein